MSPTHELDVRLLLSEVDYWRRQRGISWRQVADEIGVSASTFTRMGEGHKPSVDAFLSMRAWSGAYVEGIAVERISTGRAGTR